MPNNLWLFIVLAAAVLLVASMVYFVPVIRGGWSRLASPRRPSAAPTTGSPSPLVRGFGYLYATPRFARYRRSVGDRMVRAFQRIEAVDPDAAPRRIGLAMLQSGLVDPPARSTTAADRGTPWGAAPRHDTSGDTR